jgi:hypothetical protein
MGFRAAAMAPVVSDIGDMIVGDAEHITTTDPNIFVWPDAINLDNSVTDDTTPDAGILWSYSDDGSTRYTINGVAPLGADDPASPPANKQITQILQGEQNPDGNARSITIRDETLSPIATGGGLGPYPDPGPAGIVNPEGEVVVLIASDGVTYTTKAIIIYSDNNGLDRFAGGPVGEPVVNVDFRTGLNGWTSNRDFGTMTHSQSATNGLCMEVPALGANFGTWFSVFGFIPLVENAVYRIRMEFITNSTLNLTPLFNLVYENGSQAGGPVNAYGGSALFLDNVGGANAPQNRSTHIVYVTPLAVTTTQWNNTTTGPFAAANAATKDMRAIFRLLDVEGAGYGGELDVGQVCLRTIDIVRFAFNSAIIEDANLYNITSFTDAGTSGGPAAGPSGYQVDFIVGTTVSFSGGMITLTPAQASGWTVEVAIVRPGDKTATLAGNGAGSDIADNFPLTWEADQLYLVTAGISAVNAAAEANPPDILQITVDQPTNEIIHGSYQTTKYDLSGSPKSGAAQDFNGFWYSHNVTANSGGTPNFATFRPRVEVLCREDIVPPGGAAANTGGVIIHSIRVQKVRYE